VLRIDANLENADWPKRTVDDINLDGLDPALPVVRWNKIPKTLGDNPGHAFHGNQWTDAGHLLDDVTKARESKSITIGGTTYQIQVKHNVTNDGLSDRPHSVYRLIADNKRAADLTLKHITSRTTKLETDQVYVDDDHRRKGLATFLYAYAAVDKGLPFKPSRKHSDEGVALWKGALKQLFNEWPVSPKTLGDVSGHEFHGNQWGVGLHADGTITLLHGTTKLNADSILNEGFKPGAPAAVASMIENEYGLPKDSVLKNVAFEFASKRGDLDRVHLTSHPDIATQYSIPEVLQDALGSAWSLQHPNIENFTRDLAKEKADWVKSEAARLTQPDVLAVRIPWSTVGDHAFGKKISLDDFKNNPHLKGDVGILHSISIPLSAMKDAVITRAKEPKPRIAGGVGSGITGHTTVYHGTSGERLRSVIKDGIRFSHAGENFPGFSNPKHVYVTSNLLAAQEWASQVGAGNSAVVEVHVPASHAHLVIPDDNYTFIGKDGAKFVNAEQKMFKGDIPKEWIVKGWTREDKAGKRRWSLTTLTAADGITLFIVIPLDGDDAEPRTAGDQPGHEFHGNQWDDKRHADPPKPPTKYALWKARQEAKKQATGATPKIESPAVKIESTKVEPAKIETKVDSGFVALPKLTENRTHTDAQLADLIRNDRLVHEMYGNDYDNSKPKAGPSFDGLTVDDRLRYVEMNANGREAAHKSGSEVPHEFMFGKYAFEMKHDVPPGLDGPGLRAFFTDHPELLAGPKTEHAASNVAEIHPSSDNLLKGLNDSQKQELLDKLPASIQRLDDKYAITPGSQDLVAAGFTQQQIERYSDALDATAGIKGYGFHGEDDSIHSHSLSSARASVAEFSADYEVARQSFFGGWASTGNTGDAKIIKDVSTRVFPENQGIEFYKYKSQYQSGHGPMDDVPAYSHERMDAHILQLKAETEAFYKDKFSTKKDPDPDLSTRMVTAQRGVGNHVEAYTPGPAESWTLDKRTPERFGKLMAPGSSKTNGPYSILSTETSYKNILWSWESVKGQLGWPEEKHLKGKKEVVLIGGTIKQVNVEKRGTPRRASRYTSGRFAMTGEPLRVIIPRTLEDQVELDNLHEQGLLASDTSYPTQEQLDGLIVDDEPTTLGEQAGHEFHGNQWQGDVLFHGTKAAAVESIFKDGLKPGPSMNHVWATASLDDAKMWADTHRYGGRRDLGLSGVVLEIHAPPEAYIIRTTSTGIVRAKFSGSVKPEWIKSIKAKNENGTWRELADKSSVMFVPVWIDDAGTITMPDGIDLEDSPRTAGDNPGHEFHGNQWTADPMAGETPGLHTKEAAQRMSAYLERETGMKFKLMGSLSKGGEPSTNDMDLAYVDPHAGMSDEEIETFEQASMDEMHQAESDVRDKIASGEITEHEGMSQLYGEPVDKLGEAFAKIGFQPSREMSWMGISVVRYANPTTQHTVEIWAPNGDNGSAENGPPSMRGRDLGGVGSGITGHTTYHGTSLAFAKKIKTEGLKPGHGAVYVSSDLDMALGYALHSGFQDKPNVAVVVVKSTATQFFKGDPMQRGIDGAIQWTETRIPPQHIKEVRVYAAKDLRAWQAATDRFHLGDALKPADPKFKTLDAGDLFIVVPLSDDDLRTAGDKEGHDFHGNQWTTPEGEQTSYARPPKGSKIPDVYWGSPAEAKKEYGLKAVGATGPITVEKRYVDIRHLEPTADIDSTKLRNIDIKHGAQLPAIGVHQFAEGHVEIIDGNHRVEKWRRAGYTHIPAWVVTGHGMRSRLRRDLSEPRTAALFDTSESDHTGMLVSLHLDLATAKKLKIPLPNGDRGEDPESMHITLCYCGDVNELGDVNVARAIVAVNQIVKTSAPLQGTTTELDGFDATDHSDGKNVVIARVDIPGLFEFRQQLADALTAVDAPPRGDFEYTPHITLAYVPVDDELPDVEIPVLPLTFTEVRITIADQTTDIPFGQAPRNLLGWMRYLLGRMAGGIGSGVKGHTTEHTFLHGTSKTRLDKILAEGFKGLVVEQHFMTTNRAEAERYAYQRALSDIVPGQPMSDMAILEIRIPPEEAHRIAKDQHYREGAVVFDGDIPKEWIVGAEVGSGKLKDKGTDFKWMKVLASSGGATIFIVVNLSNDTTPKTLRQRVVELIRGAGDKTGHEFHGNQWDDRPAPTGALFEMIDRENERKSKVTAQVREQVNRVAEKMHFDPKRIDVVNTPPRTFYIGGRQYDEAGHYMPSTGRIQINASQMSTMPGGVEAITAHEITHDAFNEAFIKWAPDIAGKKVPPDEVQGFERFVADHADQLTEEDGVSDYSRAYWGNLRDHVAPPSLDVGEWTQDKEGDPKDRGWVNQNTGEWREAPPSADKQTMPKFDLKEGTSEYRLWSIAMNETFAEISARKIQGQLDAHTKTIPGPNPALMAPGFTSTPQIIEHKGVSPVWIEAHDKLFIAYKAVNDAKAARYKRLHPSYK
jgi:RNA:NAD 2'-phosphotransferase (TPT1/KptA family)/2'-5' RNA ligase